MYWCCWLSTESGLFFVSPKEETSRNPAIGGAYGLWQARDPCAIRRAIRPCPIPCHLTPWPGHRTTTRFKRQPAAPIHAHHSIAKDSDHNAGNGETKQYRSTGEHQTFNEGATAFNEPNEPGHTEASTTRMNVGGGIAAATKAHLLSGVCVRLQSTCEASRCVRENLHGLHG